jgi:hypothetical protein
MAEKVAEDSLQIRQDVVVPIPDNHNAFVSEPMCTAIIGLLLSFGMLSVVNFNGEAEARTVKVKRVRPDRMLPPEVKAVELVAAQRVP